MEVNPVFEVGVRIQFGAAHRLEAHQGRCSRLHGHTWEVEAVFRGEGAGQSGMLLDFREASSALEAAVADLDHTCLNDLEHFALKPPTAENVARLVFERLTGAADAGEWDVAPARVTVWESRDKWASYTP